MPEDEMVDAIMSAHQPDRRTSSTLIERAARRGRAWRRRSCRRRARRTRSPRSSTRSYGDEFRERKQTTGKKDRNDAHQRAQGEDHRRVPARGRAEPKYTAGAGQRPPSTRCEERVVRELILDGTRLDGRGAEGSAADLLRGRRPAAHARLGPLPARRDAGAGHHHARHRRRRAAGRRAHGRVLQEVHARLQLPAVLASASSADPRARAAARSATACWPSASLKAVLPPPTKFPYTIRVVSRHPRVERLELDGLGLRRHAGADGRRRADQRPGRRHLDRPGQGRRQVHACSPTSSATRTTSATWTSRSPAPQTGVTGIQLDLKIDGITEEIIRDDARAGPRGPAARSSRRCSRTLKRPARGDLPVRPAADHRSRSTPRRSAC